MIFWTARSCSSSGWKKKIKFENFSTRELNTRWRWTLCDKCQKHQVCCMRLIIEIENWKLFLVVGFSRSGSEKDGDGDQILETVADDDDQDGIIVEYRYIMYYICFFIYNSKFVLETRETKSANTSPVIQRKTERFLSTVVPPAVTKTRKISYKDETAKFRDHNLFSKKVPKDSEAVNIQVGWSSWLPPRLLKTTKMTYIKYCTYLALCIYLGGNLQFSLPANSGFRPPQGSHYFGRLLRNK